MHCNLPLIHWFSHIHTLNENNGPAQRHMVDNPRSRLNKLPSLPGHPSSAENMNWCFFNAGCPSAAGNELDSGSARHSGLNPILQSQMWNLSDGETPAARRSWQPETFSSSLHSRYCSSNRCEKGPWRISFYKISDVWLLASKPMSVAERGEIDDWEQSDESLHCRKECRINKLSLLQSSSDWYHSQNLWLIRSLAL